MTTRPARGHAGLRTATPVSIATEARAERFTGTAEERIGRILATFKRAAPHMQIGPHLRETIDLLWAFTQPQDWRDGARPIVWPSNACLSHELGLTERQVRNRLRALEAAGLVAAVDSPTGRRYGRRDGQGRILYAFGFDLSPLAARLSEFERAAEAAAAQREARAAFRRRLTIARKSIAQLVDAAREAGLAPASSWQAIATQAAQVGTPDSDASLHLAVQTLEALMVEARAAFEAACAVLDAARAALQSTENTPEGETDCRHIQLQTQPSSQRDTSSLKAHDRHGGSSASGAGRYQDDPAPGHGTAGAAEQTVSPGLLAFAIPELGIAADRAGEKPDWPRVVDAAWRLRHSLGISQHAWGRACQVMGREATAAAVAVIAAKRAEIRSPGGYLRGMTAKAERGELNLAASVFQVRDMRAGKPDPQTAATRPPLRRNGKLVPPPMD